MPTQHDDDEDDDAGRPDAHLRTLQQAAEMRRERVRKGPGRDDGDDQGGQGDSFAQEIRAPLR